MEYTYSIKDLSLITRIKAPTLRIWEQRYGMLKPGRTDSNIRFYDHNDLKYLLNVAILQDKGFRISSIAKLSKKELSDKVKAVSNCILHFPAQINSLVIAMMEMDEAQFEKQISGCIRAFGFEETVEQIIFPFLNQIGVLWHTNTISPAQEHFISNLIRQKLIVAIDGLPKNQKSS